MLTALLTGLLTPQSFDVSPIISTRYTIYQSRVDPFRQHALPVNTMTCRDGRDDTSQSMLFWLPKTNRERSVRAPLPPGLQGILVILNLRATDDVV
ncbi:MAG: hypothetical protein MI757_03730, partial [Pirellulales bacterium]|nr:hypothetical protein [Pirellulales bacterium]